MNDNSFFVKFRSDRNKVQIVNINSKGSLKCGCPRFDLCGLGAYSTVIAYILPKTWNHFLLHWNTIITNILAHTVPQNAGKKKNDSI